jgi:hypothetical protein
VIAGLIVLAFAGSAGSPSNLISPMGPIGLAGLGPALIGPLFAFDGWITTSYIGGEVKQPGRNLPLAAQESGSIRPRGNPPPGLSSQCARAIPGLSSAAHDRSGPCFSGSSSRCS